MKKHNSIKFSRCVPLPIGYKLAVCPICGGIHLTGTLLNESADEQDPDIMCKDCGNRTRKRNTKF